MYILEGDAYADASSKKWLINNEKPGLKALLRKKIESGDVDCVSSANTCTSRSSRKRCWRTRRQVGGMNGCLQGLIGSVLFGQAVYAA